MSIHLVPIPLDALDGTAGTWLPFLEAIAKRTRGHVAHLIEMVRSGEVQLHIAWDAEDKTAKALAGTRIVLRGDDRIGEFVWMSGSGRQHWLPLFDDLERYHRDHLGCAGFRAIARPGWSPFLKSKGYRVTHVTLEKDF